MVDKELLKQLRQMLIPNSNFLSKKKSACFR